MTNIMAFAKNQTPDDLVRYLQSNGQPQQPALPGLEAYVKDPRHYEKVGIIMSDSQASSSVEKSEDAQKLFRIGDMFITGTGNGDAIQYIAHKLKDSDAEDPLNLSRDAIKIAREQITFVKDEQLNLIVMGADNQYGDGSVQIYHCLTNRFKDPFKRDVLSIDGSGSQFVSKANQRDNDKGLSRNDFSFYTIADIAVQLYDLALAATKSSGVNDRYQFGFIIDGKSAALMSPDVSLIHAPKEYLDSKGESSSEKANDNRNIYYSLIRKLDKAYSLDHKINWRLSRVKGNVPSEKGILAEDTFALVQQLHQIRNEIYSMIKGYVEHYNQPEKGQDAK
ncbi:MAG: hypothetical protein KKE20_03435 [Nanoarchaeota archaeon]|nr:hypothetical protein [Nanoarchaeota archaeon]